MGNNELEPKGQDEEELEALVRSLNMGQIDQEVRNLLVLKSSYLSDYMKSIVEISRSRALQEGATPSQQVDAATSILEMLTVLRRESDTLLKQFNTAIKDARAERPY